jgi:hypothetical protein
MTTKISAEDSHILIPVKDVIRPSIKKHNVFTIEHFWEGVQKTPGGLIYDHASPSSRH